MKKIPVGFLCRNDVLDAQTRMDRCRTVFYSLAFKAMGAGVGEEAIIRLQVAFGGGFKLTFCNIKRVLHPQRVAVIHPFSNTERHGLRNSG